MLGTPYVVLLAGAVLAVVGGLVLRRWQSELQNSKAFLWAVEVFYGAGFISMGILWIVRGEMAWYQLAFLLVFAAGAVLFAFRLGSSSSVENHEDS
jgi:hypothetical protein